jgi:hypothetical protein
VNFARTPELRIIQPPGNVNAHPDTTITVRGITEPNARVAVRDLPENPSVVADEDGNFEITVELLPGSNVMTLQATDPATGRMSAEETRTIIVATELPASPTPGAEVLALDTPRADATVVGDVRIAGTAPPGAAVSASATLVRPATPSFTVTDAAGAAVTLTPIDPTPPDPAEWTAEASGSFGGDLRLAPGAWDVEVRVEGMEPVVRRVKVAPADGLRATLRMANAASYLEADEDGRPVAGVSGAIAEAGERFDLQAQREIRIRAGNAGAVRLSVNGIGLGTMGANGAVVEWRISLSDE